ncbi:MAG: bifunctional glycosyltransferase family 2 protein/CDP-glycerol:glycerophosphate glycerophosphotransferase [Streptosporangiaceae bacterium]
MTTPRISVVVAFYNNADDLGDCLDSIAAQSFPDLEVIMVDDGSADHSAAIARAKAAADPRFTLIQPPEHGGPGGARNRGIERARGEFLAFVDGDDVLPANAYELLLHALERSGSDFVSGAVWRVGPKGLNPSALHTLAIKGRQTGTHVTKTPRLLYDVSVWNKLFRRSFWDQHQLSFPEGVVWEDLRLMTKAHVLAQAVDVIPDIIYYWRERAQGTLSITQSRTSVANLRDRMTALDDIDSFIAAHSTAALLRAHQRKALKNDLWLYVQDLHKVTDAYRAEFVDRVNVYLSNVGRRVLRGLPATHKLAYYLVQIRAMPELAELAAWLVEQPVRQVPMVRHLGRLRADLPFRTNSPVRIPASVFRPHWRDLDPYMQVDDIAWKQDRLVVTGRANVPSVDIPRHRNTSKIVVLRAPGPIFRRLPVVRPARSFLHPEATALSEQDRYNYDWSGFEFTVSPRWFRGTGEWQCYMLVRGHGVWRPARVHTPVPGPAERPRPRQVAPGLRFGARWAGLGLNLAAWRLGAAVTAVRWQDPRSVEIEVEVPNGPGDTAPAADGAELVLVRSLGAATRSFPAVPLDVPGRFRALVPLGELAGATDVVDRVGRLAGDDGMSWDAYLKRPGRPRVRVAWPEELPETRHLSEGHEAVAGQSRYGDLVIAERTARPVIDEHDWQPDGRLVLRGSFLGASADDRYETVLRRIGSADSHVIGFEVRDERFTIEADLNRMPFFGSAIPLRDGEWNLYVRPAGTLRAGAEALAELKYDHGRLDSVTGQRVAAGRKWYRLVVTGHDSPMITAEPQLRRVEQGNFGARALRRGFYPAMLRGTTLRDQVFFVSWKGKSCGDNPLGIAEELRRRDDDREHLWAVTDWSVPVPEGGTAVLRGTQEYYEALARSKYIISNDDMQAPFRKRDDQTYLQTWHGTPLKKIGFDIANPQFISGTAYFDHLAKDIAQWDLLLSPNPFSTPVMRGAFRYEGEICEYGYPRNDLLGRSDAAEVAARVRDRLGLPAGKRVVLYAPTWRDNQVYANGRRYRFDMRLDLERAWSELGQDHVVLIRGHHHMADDVPAGMRPGFAVNVTSYPDITELYLVSDVLVTDYSSTMFDYAVTGRPMLFFTYDLADYRDNLRGFYFDFEAEAPGPLLPTSDEVIAAIRDVDAVAASYRDAYERFKARFASLDDGKAGARVCDRLFPDLHRPDSAWQNAALPGGAASTLDPARD